MTETLTLRARFDDYERFEDVLNRLKESGLRRYDAFGPVNLVHLEHMMPKEGSHVRVWATIGAVAGLVTLFLMAVYSSFLYDLIVWGKPPRSNVPFVVPAYEGTILFGAIAAFVAVIIYAKMSPKTLPVDYRPEFSDDTFGIVVQCSEGEKERVRKIFEEAGALEIDEF